ncbi:MAG: alcohol dehydrogenase, partial [Anaerolineaceae bacterium]
MRGLWLENQQLSFDDDLPLPVPGEGEALVKVRLAGICA